MCLRASRVPAFARPANCSTTKYIALDTLLLNIYGIKEESPQQCVAIKKSDTDRRLSDYEPIHFSLLDEMAQEKQQMNASPSFVLRRTQMRLHFSQTTANNNRKHSGPNPEQRYFKLIVQLQSRCALTGEIFNLFSSISERGIVRVIVIISIEILNLNKI